jgi:hypothetical protein
MTTELIPEAEELLHLIQDQQQATARMIAIVTAMLERHKRHLVPCAHVVTDVSGTQVRVD